MQTIIKVARVFRNMFTMQEPGVHKTAIALLGPRLFLLFILNLLVPLGYVTRILLLSASKNPKSTWLVPMVESGFFHSALRVVTPEERLCINAAYARLKDGRVITQGSLEATMPRGYAKIGKLLSAEECAAVVTYLKNEQGYMSQVPMQSDGKRYSYAKAEKEALLHGRYFSYAPSVSLKNPVINGLLKNDQVQKLVRANLGTNAVLFSVNTFVVFPGENVDHYVMKTHRDYDDFNFIAFFIYWTEVTASNGATLFVPGTHISSDPTLLQNQIFLEGTPGDMFALDSFGYHSGNSRVKTPRFVTWFRYGLKDNLAAVQDGWPFYKVQKNFKSNVTGGTFENSPEQASAA